MLIEIRLLVRLFRIPLVRAEGFVVLRDDDDSIRTVKSPEPGSRPDAATLTAAPGKDHRDLVAGGRIWPRPKRSSPGINSSSRT